MKRQLSRGEEKIKEGLWTVGALRTGREREGSEEAGREVILRPRLTFALSVTKETMFTGGN